MSTPERRLDDQELVQDESLEQRQIDLARKFLERYKELCIQTVSNPLRINLGISLEALQKQDIMAHVISRLIKVFSENDLKGIGFRSEDTNNPERPSDYSHLQNYAKRYVDKIPDRDIEFFNGVIKRIIEQMYHEEGQRPLPLSGPWAELAKQPGYRVIYCQEGEHDGFWVISIDQFPDGLTCLPRTIDSMGALTRCLNPECEKKPEISENRVTVSTGTAIYDRVTSFMDPGPHIIQVVHCPHCDCHTIHAKD